jgi:hypothetical protein
MGIDHPEGRKHQVETPITGHYSKTHFRLGYFYRITIWACRLDLMLVVAKIQSVFQNNIKRLSFGQPFLTNVVTTIEKSAILVKISILLKEL